MRKPNEKLINKLNVIGKIYPIRPDKINNKLIIKLMKKLSAKNKIYHIKSGQINNKF